MSAFSLKYQIGESHSAPTKVLPTKLVVKLCVNHVLRRDTLYHLPSHRKKNNRVLVRLQTMDATTGRKSIEVVCGLARLRSLTPLTLPLAQCPRVRNVSEHFSLRSRQREAQHCASASWTDKVPPSRLNTIEQQRPANPTYTNSYWHLLPRNMVSGCDSSGTRPQDVGYLLYMRRLHPTTWCARNKCSDGDRMFWNHPRFDERVNI
jgi:hypothetical protein